MLTSALYTQHEHYTVCNRYYLKFNECFHFHVVNKSFFRFQMKICKRYISAAIFKRSRFLDLKGSTVGIN
jgi:hypothetical protein